jgi:hypothetical protein
MKSTLLYDGKFTVWENLVSYLENHFLNQAQDFIVIKIRYSFISLKYHLIVKKVGGM